MNFENLKPIKEGDADNLLQQAADGELLLYVALRPFTAKLQPFGRTVKEPKQSEWKNNAGEYVSLNPDAAKGLCMFPDAKVAWFEPEGSWEEDNHYYDHVWVLDEPQTITRDQVYFEAVNSEGLDVFKSMDSLTASELTVRLLRKDEKSQPDRVAIEVGRTKRTVTCLELGLMSKKTGLLNREGQMLVALEKRIVPRNIKAPEQAMVKLREIFRGIIGTKADPFHPRNMNWKPRFKLLDAIKEADKRAAFRILPVKERIQGSKMDDTDRWIAEHDK